MGRTSFLAVIAAVVLQSCSLYSAQESAGDPVQVGAATTFEPDTQQRRASTDVTVDYSNPVDGCATAVRFVAVGNTGFDKSSVSATKRADQLGNAMAAHCARKGCDFAMLLGNTIYPQGASLNNSPSWNVQFKTPFGSKMPSLPFWHVMGPMDYGAHAHDAAQGYAAIYTEHASIDPQWRMPSTAYKFTAVDKEYVEFYAMDSTQMLSGKLQHQVDKLWPQLAASPAKFRVAFAHHAIMTNETTEQPPPGLIAGYNKLVCKSADVLITASDRSMQWFDQLSSCATPTIVNSGAGSKLSPLLPENHKTTTFRNFTKTGFLYVAMGCGHFHGEFINIDGARLYTSSFQSPLLAK